MSRYNWMKASDDEVADQMVFIGQNMANPTFKALLNIADADEETWQTGALWLQWMQKTRIPAYRNFAQTLTDRRDLFETDKTPENLLDPDFVPPALPAALVGKTLRTDYFAWCNTLMNQWRALTAFTTDLQRQFGLEIPPAGSNLPTTSAPRIVDAKTMSGGVIRVRVFKGGHPQVEVRAVVDGATTITEKTIQSTITLQVAPGAAHSVLLSCRFLERDNTPASDWSAAVTASSLA